MAEAIKIIFENFSKFLRFILPGFFLVVINKLFFQNSNILAKENLLVLVVTACTLGPFIYAFQKVLSHLVLVVFLKMKNKKYSEYYIKEEAARKKRPELYDSIYRQWDCIHLFCMFFEILLFLTVWHLFKTYNIEVCVDKYIVMVKFGLTGIVGFIFCLFLLYTACDFTFQIVEKINEEYENKCTIHLILSKIKKFFLN